MSDRDQPEFDLGDMPDDGNQNGFYLMHRCWMDHKVFGKPVFTKAMAWCWLIEQAQWRDAKWDDFGRTIVLRRGQLSVSLRELAAAWKWSKSSVDRFITRLKTESMIGTRRGNFRMVITICNYEIYQTPRDKSETQSGTSSGTSVGQVWDTNKERKERKERKKTPPAPCGASPPQTANGLDHDGLTSNLPAATKPKGSRFKPQAVIPPAWLEWAIVAGHSAPHDAYDRFTDYWVAVSGQRGLKLDWMATWRNWIRKDLADGKKHGGRETADENTYRRQAGIATGVAQQMDALERDHDAEG